MRYEVSKRIRTSETSDSVRVALRIQLKNVANRVKDKGDELVANGIETSFGSISRASTAALSIRPAQDGHLVVAKVHYRPSFWFWVLLLILLPSFILWLLPIVFYLTQKSSVRTALEKVLDRVDDELSGGHPGSLAPATPLSASPDSALQNLAQLHASGALTDAEFAAAKARVLAG